ncbi:hypothetical protein ACTFIV_010837 [Dictyostelium citrinum]
MRTLIERYYSQYYFIDTTSTDPNITEDQYVNQHTNELAVIGVAPSHPVLQQEIEKIEFRENAINNEVSGVRKTGGFKLQSNTILCVITCSNGKEYFLRSCIKGKLLEINKELINNPSLLKTNHATSGFLAIVEPMIKDKFMENPGLIKFEEYHKLRNIPIQKGPVFLKDNTGGED